MFSKHSINFVRDSICYISRTRNSAQSFAFYTL